MGAYSAGLHGVVRGVALDLGPVRCDLISPGLVETDMHDWLIDKGQWEGVKGLCNLRGG